MMRIHRKKKAEYEELSTYSARGGGKHKAILHGFKRRNP
jgi:hypothetical protein